MRSELHRLYNKWGGGQGGRPLPLPTPYLPLPSPRLPPPFWSGARFARAKLSSFPLPPFSPPLSLLPPPLLPPPAPSPPPPLLPPPAPSSPPPSYPVRPLISDFTLASSVSICTINSIKKIRAVSDINNENDNVHWFFFNNHWLNQCYWVIGVLQIHPTDLNIIRIAMVFFLFWSATHRYQMCMCMIGTAKRLTHHQWTNNI